MMITNSAITKKPIGLYIHIPFCAEKCRYCDFYSLSHRSSDVHKAYTEALIGELEQKAKLYSNTVIVDTIFIGGGTPSLINKALTADIMSAVKAVFDVTNTAEITIEANPGTIDSAKLECYLKIGINRLSFGVQSFDNRILKSLGRIHTAEEAVEGYKLARAAGFENINLDLMFAVPGHTMSIWEKTLEKVIELNPEHISFYSLQLEEGTPMFEDFDKGKISLIDDEEDRRMYAIAVNALQKAGYCHYEISNMAKPGKQCSHNLKYWNMGEYLGCGAAAHSYTERTRHSNICDVIKYTEAQGKSCVVDLHVNTMQEDASEFVITGMRKTEGINLDSFEMRYGQKLFEVFPTAEKFVLQQVKSGNLICEGSCMRFTAKGINISNTILEEFV